jgi:ribosomal-protein-alanine N-acetyltransferase
VDAVEGIETERLLLRPRRVEDAVVLRRLWAERDPRVPARRRIDADGRPSVPDLEDLIRSDREGDVLSVVLSVVVASTGEVVGYCGLVPGDGAHDPEIAFELLRSAQGHGYATEAARAVVTRASDAGHPRLWATVWDWNVASRRVLAKLGFVETGEAEAGEHGRSLLTVLDLGS